MRSVLPPNATDLERAVETAAAERIEAIDLAIARTSRSADCPVELLPWLAHSFSVDVWDDAWPEARKRAVIARSISVHRRKGTLPALIEALELVFGAGASVEEWWEFGGEPGTFRLTIPGFEGPAQVALLDRVVDSTKPSHAHLAGLRVSRPPIRVSQRIAYVRHVARRTTYIPIPTLRIPAVRQRLGFVRRELRLGTIGILEPRVGTIRLQPARVGFVRRELRRGTIFAGEHSPPPNAVYADGSPVIDGNSYVVDS